MGCNTSQEIPSYGGGQKTTDSAAALGELLEGDIEEATRSRFGFAVLLLLLVRSPLCLWATGVCASASGSEWAVRERAARQAFKAFHSEVIRAAVHT
uniref:Uncharacterized protein n=1 Tax=Anopheles minimus TaxID=112268 RepID=A0A182WDA8_9DIPT